MSVSTFLLLIGLASVALGQGELGGLFNGLRYSFSYGNTGTGGCTSGNRPTLPTYPGGLSGYGQLCFFLHEMHYIYSTDCGNKIYDKYVWMGNNSTLPGNSGISGNGANNGVHNRRYISDGTVFSNMTYSYSGNGFNGNNGNNNGGFGYSYSNSYFVLTTTDDWSAITSFSYYSYNGIGNNFGCYFSYTFNEGNNVNSGNNFNYKPYNAWNFRYAPFRTTNYTGGNYGNNYCSFSGSGVGSGYSSSVCINNCPGNNGANQGWYNMPTVVCVEVDRFNSYKLTDCLGKELSSLYWTRGGNYYNFTPGTNPNPVPNPPAPTPGSGNSYATYTPYDFPSNNEQIALTLNYGYGSGTGSGYGGYYLTGTVGNSCSATWKVILSHATDAVNEPNLVPQTGLYRLYSNVPRKTTNTAHFGSGTYNIGFQGGSVGWSNFCNTNTIYNRLGAVKVTQMCLLQRRSNLWALTDCSTYNTKTYITFGWNGVSWTGWETTYPIQVSFDTNGWLTGWTGIYSSGMCQYTFDMMWHGTWDPPTVTNGVYDRVFTPLWDFPRGNRGDFYYGFGYSGTYNDDYSYGNCTEIEPDTVCTYVQRNRRPTESDCHGEPLNFYSWSGYQYETANPYGVDPLRPYMYIDPTTVTEDSYTSYMVRGGCTWMVENTREPSFQGPGVPHGHYELSESTTKEGSCKIGEKYDNVGIYPSGLPWHEYAIQDWETGEILVIMRWDGTTYHGYDNEGYEVHGIISDDGSQWEGIYGHAGQCIWTVFYDFTLDHPVLPNIKSIPAEDDWHFSNAYGIYNVKYHGDDGSCHDADEDLKKKYNTLLCVWPNGPAVLNLVQCNDRRDDYQTILQQAWWRGGQQAWVGTDYGYSYTWGYREHDDGDYDDITFLIEGTGNDGCTFSLTLWRGDDCETSGWKTGIAVLSVLCALLLVVILYFVTQGGGGGGGGGGYHEYQ